MAPAAIALPDSRDDNTPPRKKQKRNKPTLSCLECVERKTKVCGDWFFQWTSD
ncbi:uncharacterized protein BDZ99DRAFT_456959 [Mytilinidion resinicola]|uniref:Zn(2)-C6 fungal-type domain-containing protein n=1 Tax=Mytilinidion resinicola TaxID=574789 RepID=A0A6A6Z872_9PEZI|nr:uncharacterized protein BDZ99DRAFT_456959 [Mytilinidion resinicola]KAF2817200.1 hypothetical protein BDZ99DRAFT_456959 [Mytilinidion resinicola]